MHGEPSDISEQTLKYKSEKLVPGDILEEPIEKKELEKPNDKINYKYNSHDSNKITLLL